MQVSGGGERGEPGLPELTTATQISRGIPSSPSVCLHKVKAEVFVMIVELTVCSSRVGSSVRSEELVMTIATGESRI